MSVIEEIQKIQDQTKSILVNRGIPVAFELGLLSAFDLNPLDSDQLSQENLEDRDKYLLEHSRGGVQLLLNEIFSLPSVGTDLGFMATLPKPTYVLPREKPVPKAKPATRWEKFAKEKGIQKRKRERMVYDEATGEYKPRYGYKGINQVADDWLMEVPENANPNEEEDEYELAKKAKKERVAKNEKQRVRNIKEAAGIKDIHHVPKSTGTTEKQVKDQKEAAEKRGKKAERKVEAERSMHLAKLSTASMGRFDKNLEGEPKLKGIKRKFKPTVADSEQEKDSSLRIADKVVNGKYDPVKAKKEKNSKLVNVRKAIKATKSKN